MKQVEPCQTSRFNKSEAGFSIIQVLIALIILSVVSLIMISIVTHMSDTHAQLRNRSAISAVRANLEAVIRDPSSWMRTVDQNSAMNCLRVSSDCSPLWDENLDQPDFVVWQGSGNASLVYYDATNPASGFTLGAARCSTFPSTECPIKYRLSWAPICHRDPPCLWPPVRVRGFLEVNAGSESETIKLFGTLDRTKFNFEAVRGESDAFESFLAWNMDSPPTVNEGLCNPGDPSGTARSWNQEIDPTNLWIRDANGSRFSLTKAGSYSCTISSPAYLTGNHQAELRSVGGIVPSVWSQTALSARFGNQVLLTIEARFTIQNAPVQFDVMHRCSPNTGATAGSALGETFGRTTFNVDPTNITTDTIYSTLRCIRSQ